METSAPQFYLRQKMLRPDGSFGYFTVASMADTDDFVISDAALSMDAGADVERNLRVPGALLREFVKRFMEEEPQS